MGISLNYPLILAGFTQLIGTTACGPFFPTTLVLANPPVLTADGVSSAIIEIHLVEPLGEKKAEPRTVRLFSSRGSDKDVIHALNQESLGTSPARFTVQSSVAGVAQFFAFVDGVYFTNTASVEFKAGPVNASTSTFETDRTVLAADGKAAGTLTVVLKDAHGNRVPEKNVGILSDRGDIDDILPLEKRTGDLGRATFQIRSSRLGRSTLTAVDRNDALVLAQAISIEFIEGTLGVIGPGPISLPPMPYVGKAPLLFVSLPFPLSGGTQ